MNFINEEGEDDRGVGLDVMEEHDPTFLDFELSHYVIVSFCGASEFPIQRVDIPHEGGHLLLFKEFIKLLASTSKWIPEKSGSFPGALSHLIPSPYDL